MTEQTITIDYLALAKGIENLEKEHGLPEGYLSKGTKLFAAEEWEDLVDNEGTMYPNYERSKVSGLIRNKNSRRVLKPNAKGKVNVTNSHGERTQMRVVWKR